jgi:hypothetical protein
MMKFVKSFFKKVRCACESRAMKEFTASKQWDTFLARFTPEVVAVVKGALVRMRKRMPGATEMVYDNFNALVIGFGPSERASEAIFSLAIYPKWVNLFFLKGAKLKDPNKLLKGAGSVVRHVRLVDTGLLDTPGLIDLMNRALAEAPRPIDPKARQRMVIRAVQEKQRPRRP